MNSNGEAMDSPSPSFNSYFNTNLAKVVARVTTEFTTVHDGDLFSNNTQTAEIRNEDIEDDDEFEFNLLVPADGEIRPVYSVFDRDWLRDFDLVGDVESNPSDHDEEVFTSAQIQLKNLFLEDRDGDPPSSSSSGKDELEDIPHGTYCVWTPNKSPLASPGRCTKSNSTGSSAASASVTEKVKAWKLRDLLKRSKNDRKDRSQLILLMPKKKGSVYSVATGSVTGRAVRNTAAREGNLIGKSTVAAEKNKRRSYLPYRQDLFGFSVSPQTFRKMHLLPFH